MARDDRMRITVILGGAAEQATERWSRTFHIACLLVCQVSANIISFRLIIDFRGMCGCLLDTKLRAGATMSSASSCLAPAKEIDPRYYKETADQRLIVAFWLPVFVSSLYLFAVWPILLRLDPAAMGVDGKRDQ